MSASDELIRILKKYNMKVTLDIGRGITRPCTFCADTSEPTRKLVVIGTYLNGDSLSRPVCTECLPIARAIGAKVD